MRKLESVKAWNRQRLNRKSSVKSKSVKLRSVVGVIERKNDLKCGLLNVDGLTHASLEDVKSVLARRKLDICILLESKRREEETGLDANIDGYSLTEVRRSDTAMDKGGGGILYYTRQLDGLVFQEYSPEIAEKEFHFVNKERIWLKSDYGGTKTAVCGAYFGCHNSDDRHAAWNSAMYEVIH